LKSGRVNMASTIAFAYEQQRVLRKIPHDLVSAGLEKSNRLRGGGFLLRAVAALVLRPAVVS